MFRIFVNFLLIPNVLLCPTLSKFNSVEMYKNDPAVKRLQEYIQIDSREGANSVPIQIENCVCESSSHATEVMVKATRLFNDEESEQVVKYWEREAAELGLPFTVYRPAGLPICVLTLTGCKPHLPSIMLNSHFDVVPVEASLWTYPPFSAFIDDNGNMYGRGTQDTKSVSIQYLEAIRKLVQKNITLERTVHITVMPDEETGGLQGIIPFLDTDEFKTMNVGFVLDEGLTSADNQLYATYQDKRPWQTKFKIRGEGGHGSVLANGGAVEKLQTLINLVMDYRHEQIQVMKSTNPLNFGAYTTVNINIVEGGVAPNVIPSIITVVIDMRLSTSANTTEIEAMIDNWLSKLGANSTLEFLRKVENSPPTSIDASNLYWVAMQETMKDLSIPFTPITLAATSDMVVVREKGIPAIGFSSRRNMISRIHDNNEYITVENFLEGIDIYVALLKRLGNLPEEQMPHNET